MKSSVVKLVKNETGVDLEIPEEIMKYLKSFCEEKGLSLMVVKQILLGEMFPVTGGYWPTSWRGVKRIDSFLCSLEELYFTAFREVSNDRVWDKINEWNNLFEKMATGEKIRRFGVDFRVDKIYWRSRRLKDMFVLCLFKQSIPELTKNVCVKYDYLTPKMCWSFSKYKMNVIKPSSDKGRVIEI